MRAYTLTPTHEDIDAHKHTYSNCHTLLHAIKQKYMNKFLKLSVSILVNNSIDAQGLPVDWCKENISF